MEIHRQRMCRWTQESERSILVEVLPLDRSSIDDHLSSFSLGHLNTRAKGNMTPIDVLRRLQFILVHIHSHRSEWNRTIARWSCDEKHRWKTSNSSNDEAGDVGNERKHSIVSANNRWLTGESFELRIGSNSSLRVRHDDHLSKSTREFIEWTEWQMNTT